MTYRGPELLGPARALEGFDCGKPALNDWLLRRATQNQSAGTSRTWVITDETRVVAYYASATASIVRPAATKRAARNQPEEIPAVLLARLAVDAGHQARGLGASLLKHFVLKGVEVAALVGARLLLVHAMDDEARDFYLRYDFEPSPVDDHTLMLVIADLR